MGIFDPSVMQGGGGGGGAVDSVANSDGTLTISPTTGNVVASVNTAKANTWTASQTIGQVCHHFVSQLVNACAYGRGVCEVKAFVKGAVKFARFLVHHSEREEARYVRAERV